MNINNKIFVSSLKYNQIITILICLNLTKIFLKDYKLDLEDLRKNIEELDIIFNNLIGDEDE